jgi:hypothetical protein
MTERKNEEGQQINLSFNKAKKTYEKPVLEALGKIESQTGSTPIYM